MKIQTLLTLCFALSLSACANLNVAFEDKENKEEWYQLTVECLDEFYNYPAVSNNKNITHFAKKLQKNL